MGLGEYMAKEIVREIGNRSREFYEFIMPAIDMVEIGSDLIVTIDLPGFAKEDIALRIDGNILSINAKRQTEDDLYTTYYRQRPVRINKKVILPISISDDEMIVGTAKYESGVIILRVPIAKSSNITIV
jgi:HSP20 family protein